MPGLAVRYGLSVDRLLDETDVEVFEEWRLLYDMEPWGEERSDLAAGVQIMHQASAAGVKPRAPIDYMPFLKREESKPQTQEEQMAEVDAINRMLEKWQKANQAGKHQADDCDESDDPDFNNPDFE